jgi:DNA-binding NarL/FixJ family response regulator
METMRILLVDDHTLFRKGIKELLTSQTDFDIVGEAADGFQAIELAGRTQPDIILMDIDMPRCNGLEATRQIVAELPQVKIIMLTISDDNDNLFEAIRSGAQGYLLKDLEPQKLYDFIKAASRGEAPLSGVIAARILDEIKKNQKGNSYGKKGTDDKDPNLLLSVREVEVLRLIAQGRSNKEIGNILVISENTVKNHVSNIIEKLHLQNRIQAAMVAKQYGLLNTGNSDK